MTEINPDNGITIKPSPHSVPETVNRLETLVQSKGMTIFARIDQSEAAQNVGLTLPPMQLLIFGDPKTGTPLMVAYPSLAVDLPLKALVWQDASGKVWLGYNSPAYLRTRHGLPPQAFQPIDTLMDLALTSP